MSRIGRYQENILKFLKTKSFILKVSERTRIILDDLLSLSDHIPAILCLTVLNNQCKKLNLKVHGYYIAAGVDVMMLIAKVNCNRDFFDKKYGKTNIDNMISESMNWFYWCISQNIETLNLSKADKSNIKIFQMCTEYTAKNLSKIIQKSDITSTEKMKKTDIYSYTFDDNIWKAYKRKNRLESEIIMNEVNVRYGTVCRLAMVLGWLLGQGEYEKIGEIEKLADCIGRFLKMSDDFMYIERDMLIGKTSLNYIINLGIKETYMEIIDAKTDFIEASIHIGIETKTIREIIDMVVKKVDTLMHDISVDIESQYDDVSSIH